MSDSAKPKVPFTAKELFDTKHAQIRANKADFRKKMKKASEDAKSLYKCCLENINRFGEEKGCVVIAVKVFEGKFKAACEAADLLRHRSNSYSVHVQVEEDWINIGRRAVSLVVTLPGISED